MKTDEIRTRFLKFFEARGHTIVPSDSLIPAKDPSILFTGAGMNQFKEQFLGCNLTFRRAATSQKCLRTADLENVGRTSGHHTFFEMLGNFSFGDYFKKEAIAWAWEFLTEDLRLPKESLSVSIYIEDEEAYNIWLNDIKIPKEKILKLGDKDNFWPSEARKNGPNGPCGPCSEIFYNRQDAEPVEIWNLVFTQYNRKEGGALEDLPSKNIDTGMGLERIASVIQGAATNFEIDIFIPITQAVRSLLDLNSTAQSPELTTHINAIADHIRAITFSIADGVYPSNEERGFVIRKLIRKAIQRAMQIRSDCGPFLYKLVAVVVKVMKSAYPDLESRREIISQIVKSEEERFQTIVTEVVPLLKEEFIAIKNDGRAKIPGEVIFRYSDEKGVPLDLQLEIAQELNVELDMNGFNEFLKGQRERSRAKSKISKEIFAAPSGLLRKEKEWDEASKTKIRINHTATHLLHSALRKVLGEHVWQSGSLVYPERLRFDFTHPKKMEDSEIQKVEELVNKNIVLGHEVTKRTMTLEDAKREGAIALFGEKYAQEVTVRNIGDFSKELCSGDHIDNTKKIGVFKITQETSISAGTRRIEAITGDEVYEWLAAQTKKIKAKVTSGLNEIEGRAIAEKTDMDVSLKAKAKILELDEWFTPKSTENINYDDLKQWAAINAELSQIIEDINGVTRKMGKEREKQKEEAAGELIDALIKNSKTVKGVTIISSMIKDADASGLRKIVDKIIHKAPNAVILLGSDYDQKVSLVLAAGKEIVKKGISAQELIKPIASCVGGSGGGRPDLAQAGGRDVARINEALGLIYKLVEERVVS
jgi:alanyl-tRNA synthetase